MRVIAGIQKGRKLIQFEGKDIRPITDLAKESLFNILYDTIVDSDFLDLYAGSGAVGIEALSRGAKSCTFVDISYKAAKIITKNLEITNFKDKSQVIVDDCLNVLYKIDKQFHFIFMDPPFFEEINSEIFKVIENKNILISGGKLILKHHEKVKPPDNFEKLRIIDIRRYGNSKLTFYNL